MKFNETAAKAKIREIAQKIGLKIPQIEILLAQERFMARLGTLEEGKHFVWKGGSLILRLYRSIPTPRFTIDLDLLIHGFKIADVSSLLEKVAVVELGDGFRFTKITHTPMKHETPYGGTRYKLSWTFFDKPRSQTLDIDVCAGDTVDPKKISSKDVFLIDIDPSSVPFSVYPAEYIFAEKLETIFRFKTGNTRVKDFVDLYSLSGSKLDQRFLVEAIKKCFQTRNTILDVKQLEHILKDDGFLDDLEKRRHRHFANLELPHMKVVGETILKLVKQIGF